MKTQMFLLLCLATFFISCEKEANFPQAPGKAPVADRLASYVSGSYAVADVPPDAVTHDYCIELSTSNWLSGYGKFEPFRQAVARDSYTSRVATGMYVIEAKGDGISEDYARSTSELKLMFNARTNRLTGSIVTKFFQGEVLEQKIDGDALVVYEGQAMILKANVLTAQFNNGSELLSLVKGEMIIALPIKPEGWFEANLYSTGMFCTSVVN